MRFLAIPVFAALLTVGSALAPAAEPKRWALCVGVDDYVGFIDLRYCGRDASALADSLKTSGFAERQIVVMHDTAVDARYRPTKRNVEKELDLLLALAGPDDLVLVSFSGHGIHIDGRSYLCPNEADDSDPTATMLSVDELYKKLDKCPAALKLLVVDACRNDPRPPGKKSATPDVDRTQLAAAFEKPPQGIIVLASCAPGQISWEDEELKHGVFMHHVLRGLSGEADGNKNGRVTLGELYDFASSETKLHVARRFRDIQVPAQRGEINGVFELPRAGQVPPPFAVAPFDAAKAVEYQAAWAKHLGKEAITKPDAAGSRFALVPPGEFVMGATDTEKFASRNEKPRHRVRIEKPFYLQTTELTQDEWIVIMGTRPWSQAPKSLMKEGANYPANYVSWDMAVEYCRKRSAFEGVTYRLPTEAEWEYACRAGTATAYHFGDDAARLSDYAWWGGITGSGNAETEMYAHLVGGKRANAWGLFDMHGNVREWCADHYGDGYYAESPPTDPTGPRTGAERVTRGGDWTGAFFACRSAVRSSNKPVLREFSLGFRLVMVP